MGKAGQSLRQTLELYGIAQSQLANDLGYDRVVVFRWFHEQTDPTGDAIAAIAATLQKINPEAAQNFIHLYLGTLTQSQTRQAPPVSASLQTLPDSDRLNVGVLSRLFERTTNSYKFLFFLALLKLLQKNRFSPGLTLNLRDLLAEMLVIAWYPHSAFRLSFGLQDMVARELDRIDFKLDQSIITFSRSDQAKLREHLETIELSSSTESLTDYVPFRLIRPFFAEETKGLPDQNVNDTVWQLSIENFESRKPLYSFSSDKNSIVLHDEWLEYFKTHYKIIQSWVSWEFVQYMQSKNPNVTALINKIFPPEKRESLSHQRSYWNLVLKNCQDLRCIYSHEQVEKDFSLDHFLPWTFVAHDQLWNLIPTAKSVNSSKSNKIPHDSYFLEFVRLQHQGLKITHANMSTKKWINQVSPFLIDLEVEDYENLLDLEILAKQYETKIKPLIAIASGQGFATGWKF
ncbi:HNH endonuclease domain-containing protein [Spirulina major CS-329]|uniref:HNH endonuclease domain-containing protein n=1 Tax=Spirulina TaxID=1154 RepID=UPI002330DF82|nr:MULTISPECIES: HNH endonuclease domain-containing protein [Spirulina]MDB9494645.1 HNH endonuclease domain-containing protein [Spirulina subsalsa CS-330]MDB9505274.1 HNH endonuclease domain-containing protein [Spirulina major CS-329]